jgi:putative chitinase
VTILSEEFLRRVAPGVAPGWSSPLASAAEEFGIVADHQLAGWLANILHETGELRRTVENLNYRRARLLEIFPKYFRPSIVDAYVGFPRKIASRVYADRMGNGDEASGDGWTYRGRGPAQLTGRSNYSLCGAVIGVDIIKNPDLVAEDKTVGARTVGWFWKHNRLGELEFLDVCRRWNGSQRPHGMNERQKYYDRILNGSR